MVRPLPRGNSGSGRAAGEISRPVQIIGVSEDEAPPEDVKRFAAEHKVNYPIVMTTPELDEAVSRASARCRPRSSSIASRASCRSTSACSPRARPSTKTRALAGLPVNATIEEVDQTQGLKLDNSAQADDHPRRRPRRAAGGEAHRSAAEAELAVVHVRLRPHAWRDAGSTTRPAASACRSPAKSSSRSPSR